jgi:hypothetical protein
VEFDLVSGLVCMKRVCNFKISDEAMDISLSQKLGVKVIFGGGYLDMIDAVYCKIKFAFLVSYFYLRYTIAF